jgi:hypothetical protein
MEYVQKSIAALYKADFVFYQCGQNPVRPNNVTEISHRELKELLTVYHIRLQQNINLWTLLRINMARTGIARRILVN